MAKGTLVGIKNVEFNGNEGKLVKFKEYIILKSIEKFGQGKECFTIKKNADFDVEIGQEVEVRYDLGFGGKTVCTDIVAI